MTQRKKIAFIVNDTDFFLSHRLSLAKKCLGHYQVLIILPKSKKNTVIREMGFQCEEIPLSRKGTNPFQELRTIYQLMRTLRRVKPDIVHNFTIKPAVYGSLVSRWAGVPKIVITITGLGYVYLSPSIKGKLMRRFVNFLYRRAFYTPKVRVIFQNPDDQALFVKNEIVPKERTAVIPGSGVDPKKFFQKQNTRDSQTPLRILIPCRMLWDKGVGDAIEAFKKLEKRSDLQLLLAGKVDRGNPSAIPENTIQKWVKENQVQWLGQVQNMNDLYNQCDIVCLPSYREGLPMALLEASLCEKAIITTNVAGCNLLIKNKDNGLLVAPKSPNQLAEAIETLADRQSLREELGKRAKERVLKYYTCDKINEQIFGLYH